MYTAYQIKQTILLSIGFGKAPLTPSTPIMPSWFFHRQSRLPQTAQNADWFSLSCTKARPKTMPLEINPLESPPLSLWQERLAGQIDGDIGAIGFVIEHIHHIDFFAPAIEIMALLLVRG